MKRIIGSIPIIAVLVLLFGVVFNIVEQPQTALAVSPVIKVYVANPVPGADDSVDQDQPTGVALIPQTNHVQTDWAHEGTVLLVRVESGGISDTDGLNSGLVVTIETDDVDPASLVDVFVDETDFNLLADGDDGFIQFEIEILGDVGTTTVGSTPFVGANRFKIKSNRDDELKITVKPSGTNTIDVSKTVKVGIENSTPKIKNVNLDDEDVVDDEDVDIEFTITDRDSGIPDPEDKPDDDGDDEYSATVVLISDKQCTETELETAITDGSIRAGTFSCASTTNLLQVASVDDENDFDDVTDGFDVETTIVLAANVPSFVTMVVFDRAGNFEVFDGDDDTGPGMMEIITDTNDPKLDSARTGVAWDSADDEYDDGRDWIQVIFEDDNDLDPDSIDEDDFVVEGHTVRRVQWFDVDPEDVALDFDGSSVNFTFVAGGTFDLHQKIRQHVFVQLEDDLDPDETPDINIVPDGVDDEGGNTVDSEDVEADDDISPEFNIESIEGPNSPDLLVGEDEEIEIIFTSDEDIDGDPDVFVHLAPANRTDTAIGTPLGTDVDEIGTNRWRVTIDEPEETGFYNVFITGKDDEGNDGDIKDSIDPNDADGLADFFDGEDVDDDAVFFEGDIFLDDPFVTIDGEEVDVAGSEAVEFRNPFFIEIDFKVGATGNDADPSNDPIDLDDLINENSEYAEDNFDEVEITLFELDGVDLTDLVSTTDDQRFLVAIENIAIGDHEIVINAVDQAGNELDDEIEKDFEVEERDPFEVTLKPGWNLKSIPADPDDPSIDVVLGPDMPVTTVYTFDPTVPGGWLVAVRETPDDPWVGDLQEITSRRGYWIRADQIQDWEVDIPRLPGGAVSGGTPIQPPLIDLFPGWNLIPIVDVTGEALDSDFFVDADDYFESVRDDAARLLGFDTIKNEWSSIPFGDDPLISGAATSTDAVAPLNDKDIAFGDAIWLFSTGAATLVPGATVLE